MDNIILDHSMWYRGEEIIVIVRESAAVWRIWLTAVAVMQYKMDQGLSEAVIVTS